MRFLSLAASAAVLLAVPASAQPSIGVKAGLNVSNFVGDNATDSEARLGFVGGLTARVPATETLGFQIEALYSQKGEEFESATGRVFDTRLDYLEIPAMVRLAVPATPTLDLGFSAGGYLGIPLSSRVSSDGRDIDDLDLNTDYGVLIGLDVGSGPVYVDARYTLGLTNAIEFDPATPNRLEIDKKNSVISLTLGYRFGGGGSRY